jgi:hypothetical protein
VSAEVVGAKGLDESDVRLTPCDEVGEDHIWDRPLGSSQPFISVSSEENGVPVVLESALPGLKRGVVVIHEQGGGGVDIHGIPRKSFSARIARFAGGNASLSARMCSLAP